MLDHLFDGMSIPMMTKVLDITSHRQRVIAGNIANVFTPGYVKKELNFEDNLARAMGKKGTAGFMSDSRHIPIGSHNKRKQSFIVKNNAQSMGVDLDKEMASSAENQLFYSAVATIISGSFKSLRTVIRGRA